MYGDIKKEMFDLVRQEIETGTYVVNYNVAQQDDKSVLYTWDAVSAVDGVELASVAKREYRARYAGENKYNYVCCVMGQRVFEETIKRPKNISVDRIDTRLPDNVRALLGLLKRNTSSNVVYDMAYKMLCARVAQRCNQNGR